jgi:hypothetical protein
VLKELKREVADIYEKSGDVTLVDMQKYDRIVKLEKSIENNVNALYAQNRTLINNTLRASYTGAYLGTKKIIETDAKKTLRAILKPVDVTKTVNTEMAGLKWADRLAKRRADLIYEVGATLKQGLQAGESYNTMAKRLNKTILEITPQGIKGDAANALTIVRTEATRVHSFAQTGVLDKASSEGIKMTKTWETAKDERVRGNKPTDKADHVSMQGVTIPYEEDFVLPDGSKGFAPHQIGNAKNDIRCRCWLSFEVIED